jgi:hypothetical protein
LCLAGPSLVQPCQPIHPLLIVVYLPCRDSNTAYTQELLGPLRSRRTQGIKCYPAERHANIDLISPVSSWGSCLKPTSVVDETACDEMKRYCVRQAAICRLWKSRRLHRSKVASIKAIEVHRASRPKSKVK